MTRVQTKKSGRIVTTIPKGKAENLRNPNGQHLSWHVLSRERLRADPEGLTAHEDTKTTKIQYNPSANQYTIAIPTGLAHAMHMTDATLDWEFDRGKFFISIESRGVTNDE
jgi:hypothetical protein